MHLLNSLINALFDLLLSPVAGVSPWVGMTLLAIPATILLLLVFRLVSRPASIRRKRNRLMARVLELVIFKDDAAVSLGALGRILKANAAYLGMLLIPMAVACLPMAVFLVQAYHWFGLRGLEAGETAVATARFRPDTRIMQHTVSLAVSPGLQAETPAVRVPSLREVSWRIRASGAGPGWIDVLVDGKPYRKDLPLGTRLLRASPRRTRGLLGQVAYPAEPPLPHEAPLDRITIALPERTLRIGNIHFHWLLVFFVLTMAIGLLLKGPIRVEI